MPKYRGAAPIQWAVANGETETGVTTMRLDAGLDTGDVLLESRVPIGPDTTALELFPQLASIGASLMVETLRGLEAGSLPARSQDHSAATLAPILSREDGQMRPAEQPAQEIYNRWRGLYPWPGAYAQFRGKRFLVHSMRVAVPPTDLEPGELRFNGEGLVMGAAKNTALVLGEVQVEGKPRMSGAALARGFQLGTGERLG